MDIKGPVLYENCGVNEEMFPCLGKCFDKNASVFKVSYAQVCPYCQISTSLPYGPSLKTATIVECARLGYGRRVTE
jgi:hypothetical protein